VRNERRRCKKRIRPNNAFRSKKERKIHVQHEVALSSVSTNIPVSVEPIRVDNSEHAETIMKESSND
jgi:hypothetical protein